MTTGEARRGTESRPMYGPYPEYKDSGVEWLGEIPAHWDIMALKHLCSRYAQYGANEPAESYSGEGVRFLRTTDILEDGSITPEGVLLPTEIVSEYILETGDLLFSRSGTVGRSFVYDHALHGPCAYAGYLVRFVPSGNLDSRFAFYFSKTRQFLDWLSVTVISSTIGNVNGQKYANLPIVQPPVREQHAIAAFLDRETAKIDALIAKKERLIELLQEKRSALISHAVTKGLNPDVPMKDSAVEWLGEIPANWDMVPIRSLARPGYKTFTDGDWIESPYIRDEGIRLIQTGNVGTGAYREQGYRYIDEDTFRSFRCTEVFPGDVLICRLADPVGRACLAPDLGVRMITSVDVCILKAAAHMDSRFVVYSFSSKPYLDWMGAICRGGTRDRISRSMLASMRVPRPPLKEQLDIAAFLDHETGKIDWLVAKVREGIERLKEYRPALISAAVTGKIDVRGGAPQLSPSSGSA